MVFVWFGGAAMSGHSPGDEHPDADEVLAPDGAAEEVQVAQGGDQ